MHVVIFGAFGTIGRAVTTVLRERSDAVRAVGRSKEKLRAAYGNDPGVELVAADVSTPDGCARAAAGADAIVYCLGLPYTKKAFSSYPGMMRLAVEAARSAGVRRLLHISNVYPYGKPQRATVDEEHPREPCAVKGRWRKEQEDVVFAAHEPGTLETLVLRLPDFYGPFADQSMGNMILQAAAAGKKADLLGPVDPPHEFVFTPDVGPVIAALLARDDGWGDAYNFAGAGTITQREFATRAFAAAGHEPKLRIAGPGLVRFLGLFSGLMRELAEMSYLQSDPVLLDDAKLRGLLGEVHKTPYDEGIRITIEHLRARA